MSKVFIDTNVLVYAADSGNPAKMARSRELLRSLRNERNGVISTQILQEFFVAAVKKLGVDPIKVKGVVHALRNYETVLVDEELIEDAVDCSVLNRLAFWDALVVVSAVKAHCEVVWTEEMNHGRVIQGVKIENPFYETTQALHEHPGEYKHNCES